MTLVVGVVLYFLPNLVLPFLLGPVDALLRGVGIRVGRAGTIEHGFAAGMFMRWVAVVLLLLFVAFVEREPLSSLGVRMPTRKDILRILGVAAVTVVVAGALYLSVHGPGFDRSSQHGRILHSLGILGRAQVDVNAAVVEELFYRGLIIERVSRLLGRTWPAAVLSFVLFVGSHYASGSATLIETVTATSVGGLALVGLYVWRRNVVCNMIAHALMDVPNVVII